MITMRSIGLCESIAKACTQRFMAVDVRDDSLGQVIYGALEEMQESGTLKKERVLTSAQGPWISAISVTSIQSIKALSFRISSLTPEKTSLSCMTLKFWRRMVVSVSRVLEPVAGVSSKQSQVLNFCANNYLGLGNHPKVVEAAKGALDTHGFGLASVRFICGTQDLHKRLEQTISKFHHTEDTILYASCFDANAGLFEALLTKEDAVLSDSLNHASIIDGVRLCKAQRFRYNHLDMVHLDEQLKAASAAGARNKLVVTDGVFSMDGDVAPLKAIIEISRQHGAIVAVDECHATGVLGETGRGTDELHGVLGQVDIINSTLGKALGGATGGYTTGRVDVVSLLRQKSRPYLFSNTLAPSVAAASLAVFDMLEGGSDLLTSLQRNTAHFRKDMLAAGFQLGGVDHPIVPVMLGDARLASEMANKLLEEGIYVIGFSYPVVPKEQARVRVQMSAVHSPEDINHAVKSFIKVGRELGVVH